MSERGKPRLLALAGSPRQDSFNRLLAANAAQMARDAGAEVVEVNLREYPLPIFDEDIEAAGTPRQCARTEGPVCHRRWPADRQPGVQRFGDSRTEEPDRLGFPPGRPVWPRPAP